MNLMRAALVRAACGMSSRFASPRLILRNRDFRAASWPGLNELWCSGFLATASRARQPQQHTGCASHSASTPALARRLAQAARIASEREVAGRFSFSEFSVVVVIPPLKNPKIFGHKIPYARFEVGCSSRQAVHRPAVLVLLWNKGASEGRGTDVQTLYRMFSITLREFGIDLVTRSRFKARQTKRKPPPRQRTVPRAATGGPRSLQATVCQGKVESSAFQQSRKFRF